MSTSRVSFLNNPDNFSLHFGNQEPRCHKNCFPHQIDALDSCKVECFFPLNNTNVDNIKLTGISHVINKSFLNKKKPSKPYFIIGFGPPASGKSGIISFLNRHNSLFGFNILKENTIEINVDKIFQETHQWKIEKKNLEKEKKKYYKDLENKYCSQSFNYQQISYISGLINFPQSENEKIHDVFTKLKDKKSISDIKRWKLLFEFLRQIKHQFNMGKLYSTYRYFSDQISDIMLYKSAAFRYNIYWETNGFSNNWTNHIINEMKLFGYQIIVVYPFVSTPKIINRLRLRAEQEGQPPKEEAGVLLNIHRSLENFLMLGQVGHFLFIDNNGDKEEEKIIFHLHDDLLPKIQKEKKIIYHLGKKHHLLSEIKSSLMSSNQIKTKKKTKKKI